MCNATNYDIKQYASNILLMQLIIMIDYSSVFMSKEDTSIVVFHALQEKHDIMVRNMIKTLL